jgi:tRNA(His) 5'-end guanylyltransferase
MNDALGDRMKRYETAETHRRLMPTLPTLARVDGRAFHTFTKTLQRPFDPNFSEAMRRTMVQLAEHTHALAGYTQSDEITLLWHHPNYASDLWFDGRVTKMTSVLAALATLYFYKAVAELLPTYTDKNPVFDARVWQVPNRAEAINTFLWREWDATKNSVSMAAHAVYPHSELQNKNSSQKQELLFQKGINWNDYPVAFKRGTYAIRRTKETPFTPPVDIPLPEKHAFHSNPNLTITSTVWETQELPSLSKLLNKEGVLFEGEEPQTDEENR